VLLRANETYFKLDRRNRESEVSKIIESAGKAPVKVSSSVYAAFQAAEKVAKWSNGAFDITSPKGPGNYKDIKLKTQGSDNTVYLEKAGMAVSFDAIIDGFMADFIIKNIHASNMYNAMVKVGNVFRGIGQNLHGPWKITIEDDSGVFAKHALNITVTNVSVATVSASQYRGVSIFDPRTKEPIYMPSKGTAVVLQDAALAQGLAQAAFILGPDKGLEMLTKYAKGLIVDKNGRFMRTPGFL